MKATARSCANIAFTKYWGRTDKQLNLPTNDTVSMNMDKTNTVTTVEYSTDFSASSLLVNGQQTQGEKAERIVQIAEQMGKDAGAEGNVKIVSENNFPTGAGIASSAAAVSALVSACSAASGLGADEKELSIRARLGSGSGSRSVPEGYVILHTGNTSEECFSESIAPASHWDLIDIIAIIEEGHKRTGSSGGHDIANTSVLQEKRVSQSQKNSDIVVKAIQDKDFPTLGDVIERDHIMMHAVMMTCTPPLYYWSPGTISVLKQVVDDRLDEDIQAYHTIDAGANVHVMTLPKYADEVKRRLEANDYVKSTIVNRPGPGVKVIDEHLF